MSDEIGICVRTLNRSIKKLEENGLIQLVKGKAIEDYLDGYSKNKHGK